MTGPSLRDFLDSGSDLAGLPFLDLLAESIVLDRREWSPDRLCEVAQTSRTLGRSLVVDPEQRYLGTLLLWVAEAYEDEELARRFEEALPEETRSELRAFAEEARHAHRLLVAEVGRFTCAACGQQYEDATGIFVDAIDELAYCAACIKLAAAAVSVPEAPEKRSELPVVARRAGRHRRPVLKLVGAVLAAAVVGGGGMAWAGILPRRLQTVAHHSLARVGLEVPEPEGDDRSRGPSCEPGDRGREGDAGCPGPLPAEGASTRTVMATGSDDEDAAPTAMRARPVGAAPPPSPAIGAAPEESTATAPSPPRIAREHPAAAPPPAGDGGTERPSDAGTAEGRHATGRPADPDPPASPDPGSPGPGSGADGGPSSSDGAADATPDPDRHPGGDAGRAPEGGEPGQEKAPAWGREPDEGRGGDDRPPGPHDPEDENGEAREDGGAPRRGTRGPRPA